MPEIERDSGTADIGHASPEKILFGKYELGRLLGSGAFAKVYHGRNVRTGKCVAIKAISKAKIMEGGLTSHVKREISIMRRLRHPHIVELFEVLATKTKIYFVMEFVKGGQLFARVSESRLCEDVSRRYFQQLITAVECCHSHGVFHRDLKLENLLLDDSENLVVSDFGLSAVTEQIRNDGLLHTLCGTPAYVAPEILAKKGYDGAQVDVWSCGVILYVLIAGYLPFNDASLMAMYRKIYRGEFRFPKWISPDLKRLISRLLDPNPMTRITVDEILRDTWFKKGHEGLSGLYKEEDLGCKAADKGTMFLNAFDIISFSSGLNLSGLFNHSESIATTEERFVSAETPEKIMEKIEDLAKRENVKVRRRKKDERVELAEQNDGFIVGIDVHRLSESLVMVRVMKQGDGHVGGSYDRIWPELECLLNHPDTGVPVSAA